LEKQKGARLFLKPIDGAATLCRQKAVHEQTKNELVGAKVAGWFGVHYKTT